VKRIRDLLLVPLIAVYCLVFLHQEKLFKETAKTLQPVPSATFLRAVTGYLHQLTSEILFVQSSVFLGGLKPGVDSQSYAASLAHNYRQITTLYPEFQDPYYYSQSYLSFVAPEFAQATNDILVTARKAYPNNLIYPFFQGYNLFRYLDEPLKAAKLFRETSDLPEAPPMFGHLAVILAAQGGQLQAAIISLQALLRSTDDEGVKKLYWEEIDAFQQALKVQKAAEAFQTAHQRYANSLNELVPEFLEALPSFGQAFELTWKPPVVGLKRPDRK
jgi:tetratricopeptide (TPR) repeat protein